MGAQQQRFKSAAPLSMSHEQQSQAMSSQDASSVSPSNTDEQGRMKMPDFTNSQAAYASKSTLQLFRATLVYNMCNISPLVKHADPLLRLSRKVVGDFITDKTLKATLFGHFCAGEDENELIAPLKELQAHGIGGILDYAAEPDMDPAAQRTSQSVYNQPNRMYDYESESVCDEHVEVFRSCIRSVHKVAPDGFAAVKVTALGNPKLLERMSQAVVEAENLFTKLDVNNVRL